MFLSTQYLDPETKETTTFYIGHDIIKKKAFVTTNIRLAMPFLFQPSFDQTLMIPGHPKNQAESLFATLLENGQISIVENTKFCLLLDTYNNIISIHHAHPNETLQKEHLLILPFIIALPKTYLEMLFADGIVFTQFQLDTSALTFARKFTHDLQDMRSHSINHIPEMMQLIGDPQIRKFVKSIYLYSKPLSFLNHRTECQSEECHLATYSSVNLRNHNEQEGWHTDWPYHTMQEPFGMDTLGLQCMILLDDFTEENGATYFCRGSHTTRVHVRGGFENERLLAKKGTVVFWLGKMWHCGGKNNTNENRAALLANFSPISVPAKHNMTEGLAEGDFGFVCKNGKLVFK
jgi:hypothetical protein